MLKIFIKLWLKNGSNEKVQDPQNELGCLDPNMFVLMI